MKIERTESLGFPQNIDMEVFLFLLSWMSLGGLILLGTFIWCN